MKLYEVYSNIYLTLLRFWFLNPLDFTTKCLVYPPLGRWSAVYWGALLLPSRGDFQYITPLWFPQECCWVNILYEEITIQKYTKTVNYFKIPKPLCNQDWNLTSCAILIPHIMSSHIVPLKSHNSPGAASGLKFTGMGTVSSGLWCASLLVFGSHN